MKPVSLNLALQGGGAHGAFTWGVLDRLLDEDWITIDGVTATSAGAMNAAALKAGWVEGGNQGAKDKLDAFWDQLGGGNALTPAPVKDWLNSFTPPLQVLKSFAEYNPALVGADIVSRTFSPYETNPLNYHPLRNLVDEFFNFEQVCAENGPSLFISATNVRSGKIKIFSGTEITTDAILASACLPTLYQAVEILDDTTGKTEAYWDGGFMGNPALFPLFYQTQTSDVLLVHINPIHRDDIPKTAREIENRINEISFNSSLLRELRNVNFVKRLIEKGKIKSEEMMDVKVHSVADDATMIQLGVATKSSPTPALLSQLKSAGQVAMDSFLEAHAGNLGTKSSLDLKKMFA